MGYSEECLRGRLPATLSGALKWKSAASGKKIQTADGCLRLRVFFVFLHLAIFERPEKFSKFSYASSNMHFPEVLPDAVFLCLKFFVHVFRSHVRAVLRPDSLTHCSWKQRFLNILKHNFRMACVAVQPVCR